MNETDPQQLLAGDELAACKAAIAADQDAKLEALGAGTARLGEKGDRVFEFGGRSWSVRVRVLNALPPSVPTSSASNLATQNVGLCISAAPLDSGGKVMTDACGGVQLFATSITIQSNHGADLAYDPGRCLMLAIADHLSTANAQLATRLQVPDLLKHWGSSTT